MLGALGLLALSSCKKETEGVSEIINYPQMLGNSIDFGIAGQYNDPGLFIVNGNDTLDATSQCKVVVKNISGGTSNDLSKPGVYKLNYIFEWKGLEFDSGSRTVVLGDASDETNEDYSGEYLIADFKRTGGIAATWTALIIGSKMRLERIGKSRYYIIEDLLFGHYWLGGGGRGYGRGYASQGIIKVNEDNTVSMAAALTMTAWGDTVDWENGEYDPATKTFTLSSTYAAIARTFTVTLTLAEKQ